MTKLRAVYTVSFILPAKLSGPLLLNTGRNRRGGAGGRPLPSVGKGAKVVRPLHLSGHGMYLDAGLTLFQYTGTTNYVESCA